MNSFDGSGGVVTDGVAILVTVVCVCVNQGDGVGSEVVMT